MEHDDENRANRPRKSTTFLTLHKRQADLLVNTNGMSRHGEKKCGLTKSHFQEQYFVTFAA